MEKIRKKYKQRHIHTTGSVNCRENLGFYLVKLQGDQWKETIDPGWLGRAKGSLGGPGNEGQGLGSEGGSGECKEEGGKGLQEAGSGPFYKGKLEPPQVHWVTAFVLVSDGPDYREPDFSESTTAEPNHTQVWANFSA